MRNLMLYLALIVWTSACLPDPDPVEVELNPSEQATMIAGEVVSPCGGCNCGDADAIQAAIDTWSANGGGEVYLEGGKTYYLTKPVVLKSNVTLRGSSSSSKANVRTTCSTKPSTMFEVRSGTATSNVKLMYLDVAGYSDFFYLPRSSDALAFLEIAHNFIRWLGNDATQFDAVKINYRPLQDISVHHNTIASVNDGISIIGLETSTNSKVDVYNNNIRYLGHTDSSGNPVDRHGFGIYVGHSDDIDIYDNYIRYACEDGIRVGVSTNARIRNNNVAYEWKSGCNLQGIKAADSRYIYIEDNNVYDVPRREQIGVLGSSNVWIRYNVLRSGVYTQTGVKVHNSGTNNVEKVYIRYNDFYVSDPVKVFTGPYAAGTVHYTYVERNNFYDFCRGVMANMTAKDDDSFGPVRHLYVRENLMMDPDTSPCSSSNRSVELYYVGYSKVQNNCLYTAPVADRIWSTELSPNYYHDAGRTICGH